MTEVVTSMVDTPNGSHRIRTTGSGFPLLVVPGGPGYGARYLIWSLGDLLAPVSNLIFLDQRGTGGSPVGTGDLSIEAYASDMVAVLDGLGIERTDIYAHSFGALQTVLFAAQYPDRVRRLVIEEGMPPNAQLRATAFGPGTPRETRKTREDLDEVADIQKDPEWMFDHDKLLRFADVDYRWMYADPATSARLPIDIDGDGYLQFKATDAAVNMELGNDYDITSQVSQITAETMLVYAHDSILGTAVAAVYESLLPNSELVWLEGGHLPSAEDPKSFQTLVTRFLADHA